MPEFPRKRASAVVFLLAALLMSSKSLHGQRLPNFVIIFADDMGYADISPYDGKT